MPIVDDNPPRRRRRGRRASLHEWLGILVMVAILGLFVHRTAHERAVKYGRAAFPHFLWRIYEYKVWPLTLLR